MNRFEILIRSGKKFHLSVFVDAFARLNSLQHRQQTITINDVLQILSLNLNNDNEIEFQCYLNLIWEGSIVKNLDSQGRVISYLHPDCIGKEVNFLKSIWFTMVNFNGGLELPNIAEFRNEINQYLSRNRTTVGSSHNFVAKEIKQYSNDFQSVHSPNILNPTHQQRLSSFNQHTYNHEINYQSQQIPNGYDENFIVQTTPGRIEFEKSEPIVRLLAQVRKVGMDILFPQTTHDKILACIYVAVKISQTPAHKDLIDMVMAVKDCNKVNQLNHVSKTKVRGVLALLKHGELLITQGGLLEGVRVRLYLAPEINSFEAFRFKHDQFLNNYIRENNLFVPDILKSELVWTFNEQEKAKRLTQNEKFSNQLQMFYVHHMRQSQSQPFSNQIENPIGASQSSSTNTVEVRTSMPIQCNPNYLPQQDRMLPPKLMNSASFDVRQTVGNYASMQNNQPRLPHQRSHHPYMMNSSGIENNPARYQNMPKPEPFFTNTGSSVHSSTNSRYSHSPGQLSQSFIDGDNSMHQLYSGGGSSSVFSGNSLTRQNLQEESREGVFNSSFLTSGFNQNESETFQDFAPIYSGYSDKYSAYEDKNRNKNVVLKRLIENELDGSKLFSNVLSNQPKKNLSENFLIPTTSAPGLPQPNRFYGEATHPTTDLFQQNALETETISRNANYFGPVPGPGPERVTPNIWQNSNASNNHSPNPSLFTDAQPGRDCSQVNSYSIVTLTDEFHATNAPISGELTPHSLYLQGSMDFNDVHAVHKLFSFRSEPDEFQILPNDSQFANSEVTEQMNKSLGFNVFSEMTYLSRDFQNESQTDSGNDS